LSARPSDEPIPVERVARGSQDSVAIEKAVKLARIVQQLHRNPGSTEGRGVGQAVVANWVKSGGDDQRWGDLCEIRAQSRRQMGVAQVEVPRQRLHPAQDLLGQEVAARVLRSRGVAVGKIGRWIDQDLQTQLLPVAPCPFLGQHGDKITTCGIAADGEARRIDTELTPWLEQPLVSAKTILTSGVEIVFR
jgi:hypothetical protein